MERVDKIDKVENSQGNVGFGKTMVAQGQFELILPEKVVLKLQEHSHTSGLPCSLLSLLFSDRPSVPL